MDYVHYGNCCRRFPLPLQQHWSDSTAPGRSRDLSGDVTYFTGPITVECYPDVSNYEPIAKSCHYSGSLTGETHPSVSCFPSDSGANNVRSLGLLPGHVVVSPAAWRSDPAVDPAARVTSVARTADDPIKSVRTSSTVVSKSTDVTGFTLMTNEMYLKRIFSSL